MISDRSGAYWKMEWQSMGGISNADGSYPDAGLANMMAFDDRSEHACLSRASTTRRTHSATSQK